MQIPTLTASDFPPAVRPFWENCKKDEKLRLAMTLAALVCYCSHSSRLRVHYTYDPPQYLSMLLCNLLVIGPSGSGKSQIRFVVNMLMQPQICRDQEERLAMRRYRDMSKRKSANKDKGEEPLVAIRFLQKFTLPVIVKYADFMYRRWGDWMPFFLYADELAAFSENGRGHNDFAPVARTAYATGEMYSRDTLYADGYNAMVDILWNSVLCGQAVALDSYIDQKGIVAGDAGRQILVKLRESLAEDAPTLEPFSDEQARVIRETVAQLMAETYTDDDGLQPIHQVDMSWLHPAVRQWCGQNREQILKNGSLAQDSYYVRASTSAFRLATMLYHLWGETEASRSRVRRCYYYLAQYILDANLAEWGARYEAALAQKKAPTTKKVPFFDLVPNRFTRDSLKELIIKEEINTEARVFIFKWKQKGWIIEVEKDVFEKR